MSALNSGVNERRGRGFLFAMVSIMDILSGASPLIVDVRQTDASPFWADRLWELLDAGETLDQISDGYDMSPEDVRAAISYEEQLRALAA